VRTRQGYAVALIFLAVAGCTKAPRSTSAAASQPLPSVSSYSGVAQTAAAPAGPVKPPGADPAGAIAPAQKQPPVAPASPVAAKVSSDVASLLPLGRGSRVLPEDFKIGVLADPQIGEADERQAMAAAGSFFSRLSAGKVDQSLLAASAEGRISDMLDFGVRRGNVPRTFRIGTPKKHENGEISSSVRLFSSTGSTEGEVSLARTGGHWLVSDLQISLDDLQVKREKPKARFFPSSYRWLLQE